MGVKGAETAAGGGATSNVDEKSESMLLLAGSDVTGAGGAGADTGAGPPNMSSSASTSVFGGCGFDAGAENVAENVGAVLFVGAAVVGELKLSASRSIDWLDGTDGLS